MGYFTELEMFILETIGKNSNRLPTRADFELMLSAAGGSEVKLADALERLASRGLLRKSGILRATGGTPIQFSLSVMWLTQAGVDAAMSGNH
mgnify:FL=1